MKILKNILLAIFWGGLLWGASLKSNIGTQKQSLEEIQKEIMERERELNRIRLQESSVIKVIASSRRKMELQEELLERIHRVQSLFQQIVDNSQRQIDSVEQNLNWHKKRLQKRIRTLYQQGKPDYITLLNRAEEAGDFLRRVYYWKKVSRKDRNLVYLMRREKNTLSQLNTDVEKRLAQLNRLDSIQTQQKLALNEASSKHNSYLKKVRNNRKLVSSMLEEYKRSQEQIENLIEKMEAEQARIEKEQNQKAAQANKAIKGKALPKLPKNRCAPTDG